MSYFFSATSVSADNCEELLTAVSANCEASNPPSKDVLPVVIKSVSDLLKSGKLGDPTKLFNISVNGHANENHSPQRPWANDCVTISIQQV